MLDHKDQAQRKRPTTEQTKKPAHSGPQRELACTSSRRQTWVVDAERCVWCSTTHTTRISHVIHRPTILQFFPKKARSSAHFSAFLSRQVGKYCAKVLRISLLVLTQCQPPPSINPHQSPAGQASSLDARCMRRAVHAAWPRGVRSMRNVVYAAPAPPLFLYSSLAQAELQPLTQHCPRYNLRPLGRSCFWRTKNAKGKLLHLFSEKACLCGLGVSAGLSLRAGAGEGLCWAHACAQP